MCNFQTSLWLSKSVQPSPRTRCEFSRGRPKSYFFRYIFGTGSRSHDSFTLDAWTHYGFQTSQRLFKSVQPFPRNRYEFMEGWSKNHISGYISVTGSCHHDLFPLDLRPYFSFQTSPGLSKSIQPSLRKRCEFNGSRPKNHIPGYISETGSRRHRSSVYTCSMPL